MLRKTLSRIMATAIGAGVLATVGPPPASATPSAVFGREELYTLNSGNISALRASGFTTVILFVVDVASNGDLNYNGNHLIVQNGTYVGDSGWPSRLNALRVAPTSICRIEVCTGGAGAQSWNNIKNLIASQGTGTSSILYRNFLTLKNTLGIDAIDNDDEIAYDASSAAAFNRMITSMGMKNTLCPYNNPGYWQSVFNNSSIDRIYLQCYDGGAGNNPSTWSGYFGGFPVDLGDWNNDGVAGIRTKMTNWGNTAGVKGGFIWQLEFLGDGNLAAYAQAVYDGIQFRGNANYRMSVKHSGQALDASGNGTANGTPLIQWPYGGGTNQQWYPNYLGNNQYQLIGVQSGRSVDSAGNTQNNNAPVVLYDWTGGNNQRFTFSENGGNYWTPIFVHSGKALNVNGGSTTAGATIIQYDNNGGTNAQWCFGPL